MSRHIASDVLVAGGGLAGLVTALELLRAGKRVTLVDRDTPERLGGLALWRHGTDRHAAAGCHENPRLAGNSPA
jgi:uncharacterized protein